MPITFDPTQLKSIDPMNTEPTQTLASKPTSAPAKTLQKTDGLDAKKTGSAKADAALTPTSVADPTQRSALLNRLAAVGALAAEAPPAPLGQYGAFAFVGALPDTVRPQALVAGAVSDIVASQDAVASGAAALSADDQIALGRAHLLLRSAFDSKLQKSEFTADQKQAVTALAKALNALRTPVTLTAPSEQTKAAVLAQTPAMMRAAMKAAAPLAASQDNSSDLMSGNGAASTQVAAGQIVIPGPQFTKLENLGSNLASKFPGVDIDALCQIVMTECSQESDNELSDVLQQMQQTTAQKAAIRNYETQAKAQRAALDAQLETEYNAQVASGAINPQTTTFSQYEAQRQITSNLGDPSEDDPTQLSPPIFGLSGDPPVIAAPPPSDGSGAAGVGASGGSGAASAAPPDPAAITTLEQTLITGGMSAAAAAAAAPGAADFGVTTPATAQALWQLFAAASPLPSSQTQASFEAFLAASPTAASSAGLGLSKPSSDAAATAAIQQYNEMAALEQQPDPGTKGQNISPATAADIYAQSVSYNITSQSMLRLYQTYCEAQKIQTPGIKPPPLSATGFDTFLTSPVPTGTPSDKAPCGLGLIPGDSVSQIQQAATSYISSVQAIEAPKLNTGAADPLIQNVVVLELLTNMAAGKMPQASPPTDPIGLSTALSNAQGALNAFINGTNGTPPLTASQKQQLATEESTIAQSLASKLNDTIGAIPNTVALSDQSSFKDSREPYNRSDIGMWPPNADGSANQNGRGWTAWDSGGTGAAPYVLDNRSAPGDSDVHLGELALTPNSPPTSYPDGSAGFGALMYQALAATTQPSLQPDQIMNKMTDAGNFSATGPNAGWGALLIHTGYRYQDSNYNNGVGSDSFFKDSSTSDLYLAPDGDGRTADNSVAEQYGTWGDQKDVIATAIQQMEQDLAGTSNNQGATPEPYSAATLNKAYDDTPPPFEPATATAAADSVDWSIGLTDRNNKSAGTPPRSKEEKIEAGVVTSRNAGSGAGTAPVAHPPKKKEAYGLGKAASNQEAAGNDSTDGAADPSDASDPASAADGAPPDYTRPVQVMTITQLDADIQAWDDKNSTLGDMSTSLQMKIQLLMDQSSKIEEALSNIMKSISDTGNAIVQNIKTS